MTILDPIEVQVGEHRFYILKFPALKSAHVIGQLNTVFSPLASGIIPLVGMATSDEGADLFSTDITKALPMLSKALITLDGPTLQSTLELLLLKHNNVSVEVENAQGEFEVKKLNRDMLDTLFCGEVQDMFELAYKVISINYGNFFGKLLSRFGVQKTRGEKGKSKSTEPSTPLNLQTLS